MKTFKHIDLAGQLLLSAAALIFLVLGNGETCLMILFGIGGWHLLSNIVSLIMHPRSYHFYRRHMIFFFSFWGYMGLTAFFVFAELEIGMYFALGTTVAAVFWYIYYLLLTIHECNYWKELEMQQTLVDLGH
jgi:hypothetical protein